MCIKANWKCCSHLRATHKKLAGEVGHGVKKGLRYPENLPGQLTCGCNNDGSDLHERTLRWWHRCAQLGVHA